MSNKVLVDFDELEECYRMAASHIRDVAVDIDEESTLLLDICKIKAVIDSHNRNVTPDLSEKIDIKNWDYVPPNLYIQIEFKDYFTDKGVDTGDLVKIDNSTDTMPIISVYANNGVIYQAPIKEWRFLRNEALGLLKLFINDDSECLVVNGIPLEECSKLQNKISTATGLKNVELKQVIEP